MPCHLVSRSAAIGTILALLALGPTPTLAQAEAEGLTASFRKAARRILPAVVTVRPVGAPPRPDPIPRVPLPDPFAPGMSDGRLLPADPGGSGLVIDADKGLILTNDHVIQGGPRVVVTLPDGRQRTVRQIRRDPRSDLALLSIDPGGLVGATWGDSSALDTGDWVLAIGQPFGLSGTVTAGIVSGKGRGLGAAAFHEDLIQTDAAINPGNSGGPLVNLQGEVVGINVALKTLHGGYEGVGFAVPAGRAKRVASDLAEFGRVRRSYLGVDIRPGDPEAAERLGQPGAVLIASVAPGSPAQEAGLRAGDLVATLEGKPVAGTGMLKAAIEFAPVGEPITLGIVRDSQALDVRILPEARPEAGLGPEPIPPPGPPAPRPGAEIVPMPEPPRVAARPAEDEPPLVGREQLEARSPTRFPTLGLRLDEPNPTLLRRFALDTPIEGLVVVGVEPDGPADRAGLEVGMVVTDVAHRKVTSLAEFRAALARRPPGTDLVVRIRKAGKAGFRVLLDPTRPEPPREGPPPQPPDGPSTPAR